MKKMLLTSLTAAIFGCSAAQSVPSTLLVIKDDFQYRGIVIEGPPAYTQNMMQALELIYARDPGNWAIVEHNITTIRLNPPSGIYVHTGVFDTDANITTPTSYQPLPWVAGEIVHDAWHREYFRRGEAYGGWEGEKKCMERQNEFFGRVGHAQINIEKMLQMRYWETQRDW